MLLLLEKVAGAAAQRAAEGVVMAQTAEEIQKEIELVTKQKDLAAAQKALLDAQIALTASQKTQDQQASQLTDQVAAAKAAAELSTARKTAAEAEKATADAQKAKSEASAAAFKAAIGEVPAGGLAGGITLGAGAGDIEATLLATKAVKKAAETIAARIHQSAPTGRILALAVSEVPAFQNHIAYQAHKGIVTLALNRAVQESQNSAAPQGIQLESPAALFGGAGLVLDNVNKLLGFFRTEYTFAGITVELSDLVALTEVTDRLARLQREVVTPAIFNATAVADAGKFLVDDITVLAAMRGVADNRAGLHDTQTEKLTKDAATEQDPAKRSTLLSEAQRRKGLADALRAAMALFDAWFTKLTTADDQGVVAVVTIAKEKAIADQLAAGGKLLVVKVQKAGGGNMTKKNMWSYVLGGAPLYHMGGASVSYALLDGKTGVVAAAGVVPIYGGYVKSNEVAATLSQ